MAQWCAAMNELHVTICAADWEVNDLNPDPEGFCPVASAISVSLATMGFAGISAETSTRNPVFWLVREETGERAGPFNLCGGLEAHWRRRWVAGRTVAPRESDSAWQPIQRATIEAWPEFGAWHEAIKRENEIAAVAVRTRDLRMQAFRNLASPGRQPGPRAILFAQWLHKLWTTNRSHGFDLAVAFANPADAHRVLDGAEIAGWLRVWSWSPKIQQRATMNDADLEQRTRNECCIWEVACDGNGWCEHVHEFLTEMREHLSGDVSPKCIECQWADEMDKAEAAPVCVAASKAAEEATP